MLYGADEDSTFLLEWMAVAEACEASFSFLTSRTLLEGVTINCD